MTELVRLGMQGGTLGWKKMTDGAEMEDRSKVQPVVITISVGFHGDQLVTLVGGANRVLTM